MEKQPYAILGWFWNTFSLKTHTTKRTNSNTVTHVEWYLLKVRKSEEGREDSAFNVQVNPDCKEFKDFFFIFRTPKISMEALSKTSFSFLRHMFLFF